MKSQEPMTNKITKSPQHKTYKVLTEHEVTVLEAVHKNKGIRHLAAEDLGMTERAITSLLSRVRLKLEGAMKARRRYGNILKRQR